MRFRLLRSPVSGARSGGRSAGKFRRLLTGAFPLVLLPFCTVSAEAVTRVIPDDVPISAFIKPSGQHLQLLIRIPLVAMNEVQFPVRSNGFIDLERAQTMLPGVARY